MGNIIIWLKAVLRHWTAIVTGGVIIGVLAIYQGTGHSVKPWVYWLIAIMGTVVALFRAWQDEHNEHKAALLRIDATEEEIRRLKNIVESLEDDGKINLGIRVPSCVVGLSDDGMADILFPVTIKSSGAPSATTDLQYKKKETQFEP